MKIDASLDMRVWSQEISQAYLQSAHQGRLRWPPPEFGLERGELLRLEETLYGLCNAGDYWHRTKHNHLQEEIQMRATTGDRSFIHKKSKRGDLFGMVGAYVYDTLNGSTAVFREASAENGDEV